MSWFAWCCESCSIIPLGSVIPVQIGTQFLVPYPLITSPGSLWCGTYEMLLDKK